MTKADYFKAIKRKEKNMKTKRIEIIIKGAKEDKKEAFFALLRESEDHQQEILFELLNNMKTGDIKEILLALNSERLIKIAYTLHGALYKYVRDEV